MRDELDVSDNTDIQDTYVDEGEEDFELKLESKKRKPGIVYLSSIPKYMTAACLREVLSHFGEVGRVYLQEDVRDVAKAGKKKKKIKKSHARNYAEGWVEFKSKRVAKEVAQVLNNTHIGGRKRSKFYDCIWTIKYLPRFKWTHLSERLAYERAVYKQRMRAEICQAKREADYFSLNVDHSENLKNKLSKGKQMKDFHISSEAEIHQRETEDHIIQKSRKEAKLNKERSGATVDDRDAFLKTLFS